MARVKEERYRFRVNNKIDYRTPGRKSNGVELEVTLGVDTFDRPTFSASGKILNNWSSGCVCCGQGLDVINEYRDRFNFDVRDRYIFDTIYDMWKKYHLNDLTAGTPEQEAAIKEWKEAGNKYDYTNACRYLESIGLYEVEYHGLEYNGMYKYGHAWLYTPIDKDDWQKILDLCHSDYVEK